MISKINFNLNDILVEEKIKKVNQSHRDISSTSIDELNKNMKISNPYYFATGHSYHNSLDRDKLNQKLLINYLKKNYGGEWRISGAFLYNENNYLGWHTNNGGDGTRCYFSYSFEDNSNIFRYRNPYTKEVIDSYDKIGWNVRLFTIDKDNPFWHCVIANSKRYSFGFRNANPSKELSEKIKLCLQSPSKTEETNHPNQIGL